MNPSGPSALWKHAVIIAACFVFFVCSIEEGSPLTVNKKGGVVWLVLFFSEDCPHCESVKDLTKALKSKYSIRIKMFTIDNQGDYAVYSKLQGIHAKESFAVPLIMVGDKILIGENQITAVLEDTIRRLSASGGSGLPYLGSGPSKKRDNKSVCPDCDADDRRKPSVPGRDPGRMKILEDAM